MIREALIKWAVAAMTTIQPPAVTPWADTYRDTADAFAVAAEEQPLFKGDDGMQRTMSWLISTAWFEGRFDPKAKGDGACLLWDEHADAAGKPKCLKRGPPNSFCMFQIGRSNFDFLKVTEQEILTSTLVCTRSALTMMKSSISLCRSHPQNEWLAQYASGGGECGGKLLPNGEKAGLLESRHRVNKAKWVFANVKTPE